MTMTDEHDVDADDAPFDIETFMEAPTWFAQAACRGLDPDLFFPERGESVRQAKAVCASCPVAAECLATALNNGEKHGIWGGLSEKQRRVLRRTGPHPINHGTDGGYRMHLRRGELACPACLEAHAAATAIHRRDQRDRGAA